MKRVRSGDGRVSLEEVNAAIEKRVFLGKLPADTSEDELRTAFGEFGQLNECRKVAGKTMGFVSYNTWAACHRALRTTDGKLTLQGHAPGQTIVASFAERTSSVGRGGGRHFAKGLDNSRIFVGGLPEDITDEELKSAFESFGQVEAIQMLPAKTEKRCGFVTYSIWGEALDAIEGADAQPLPNRNSEELLTVVLAEPKGTKPGHAPQVMDSYDAHAPKRRRVDDYSGSDTNVMADLERLTDEYLQAVSGDAPEEVCTQIHWNIMSMRHWAAPSPGYGGGPAGGGGHLFPAFPAAVNGHRAASSGGSPKGGGGGGGGGGNTDPRIDPDAARLFLGGLPYECTDEELRLLVQQIELPGLPSDNELLECRVLPSRGCGYLRFATWEAAEGAMQALNDRTVDGWKHPLRAKWATPKSGAGGGSSGGHGGGFGGGFDPSAAAELLNWMAPAFSRASAPVRSAPVNSALPKRESHNTASNEVEMNRLFVGQLFRGARREDVAAVFEPFGKVEECKFLEDKGVAYISYADAGDAARALKSLDGREIRGISRGAGLNVQFSKPR